MKRFAIIMVVIYTSVHAHALNQALVDEMRDKVQKYGIECAESENATPEDITALMSKHLPVTHAGKCLIFCTAKKLNIMREDGSVGDGDTDWLDKAKVDDHEVYEKLIELSKTCSASLSEKKDLCQRATEYAACAYIASQKNGLSKYVF